MGLINLLSKETRKLNEQELTVLNTISELVGTAVQRTRMNKSFGKETEPKTNLKRVSEGIILPKIEAIITSLKSTMRDNLKVSASLNELVALQNDLNLLLKEVETLASETGKAVEFSYPDLPITKRELQVLCLIKEGLTNDQIGNQLFITERTVKFHISSILSKLNAKNRTEAVDVGLKRGLFSI